MTTMTTLLAFSPRLSASFSMTARPSLLLATTMALALGLTGTACDGTVATGTPDVVTPEPTPQPTTPTPGTPEPGEPGTPTPDGEPGTPEPDGEPATPTPDPIPGAITESLSPKVKFLGGQRLNSTLAQALSLAPNEVCIELGLYDCVNFVHKISLGGVDAPKLRIDEPFKTAPIATPIAVDRVVLNACQLRAERDFAAPTDAVIFGALAAAATGLADADAMHTSVGVLFQKLLRRSPTESELEKMDALATETVAQSESAQTFATLACFVAGSSIENLFY